MKIFGIDPGSERTGYGCIESSGGRYRVVICGILSAPPRATFPEKLLAIHRGLRALLARHEPECVAVENIFYAKNVRSALKLGHARGVALLAASEAAIPVAEYSPAEIKRSVVGYGRAEKHQVQGMMKVLLGLEPCRRRTTSPTRWPSRSATSTPVRTVGRDAPGAGRVVRSWRTSGPDRLPRCQNASMSDGATFDGHVDRLTAARTAGTWQAMIARLSGLVAEKTPSRIVVDVAGVGYDVLVPLSTFYVLGEPGAAVTLRIHTHVREESSRCMASPPGWSRISSSG